MKVFKTLNREVICHFDLSANSPVIVSDNRLNKIDVTSANTTFLKGNDGVQNTYVIPGSSIKGVVRHYCYNRLSDKKIDELFGNIKKEDINKGKIKFYDAYADISTVKTTIRYNTAIDKISQSAKNGSLNSVEAVVKGDFKSGFKITNFKDEELITILNAINSINSGELAFGGRTSRGFGRMLVKNFQLTINNGYNEDFSANTITFDSVQQTLDYLSKEVSYV